MALRAGSTKVRYKGQSAAQVLACHRNFALFTSKGIKAQLHVLRKAMVESKAPLDAKWALVRLQLDLNNLTLIITKAYDQQLATLKAEKENQNEQNKNSE